MLNIPVEQKSPQNLHQTLETPAPLSNREINNIRHRAERPLFWISFLITVILIIVAVTSNIADILVGYVVGSPIPDDFMLGDDPQTARFWIAILPAFLFYGLYLNYAQVRAYSVRVSERNFPEIYRKTEEYAARLGMKKVPRVYIEQSNGRLNAFAATVLSRNYAKLNAELVDIAYMEHRDFEPVYFALAHELAHLHLRHARFEYLLFTYIPRLIPLFGQLFSRAREYSCDRVAQLLFERDGVNEIIILSAGRHLYKYVDAEDYLAEAKKERGVFLFMVNLMSTHPIQTKRIAALADPNRKSGRLF